MMLLGGFAARRIGSANSIMIQNTDPNLVLKSINSNDRKPSAEPKISGQCLKASLPMAENSTNFY